MVGFVVVVGVVVVVVVAVGVVAVAVAVGIGIVVAVVVVVYMTQWLKYNYWSPDMKFRKPLFYWDDAAALAACILVFVMIIYVFPGEVVKEIKTAPPRNTYFEYENFTKRNR